MGHKTKNYSKKQMSSSISIVPDYSQKVVRKNKKHHNSHAHSHTHKYNDCGCSCEIKYYFPLPNLPTQPVSERVSTSAWLAPGSVQSCCAICSSVKPVYANPCDTCAYQKGTRPINNSAYYITNQ